MFEVRGIPILTDPVEILQDLREDVLQVTGREILRKIKPSGDNIMICCPIHKNGQERKPSCGITSRRLDNSPAGTVHCFGCGYTDTLPGMISKCFGYEDSEEFGLNWLMERYMGSEEYQRPDPFSVVDFSRGSKKVTQNITYVSEQELAQYRFYHPYMFQRKLTEEVIERYDVGYQKDYIFGEGWKPCEVVTFPVRDINGNCLFVSRRAIYGKTFFLPKNLDKPVYGLYELPKNVDEVVICESVFNALTSVVYGRPAVALFGTGYKHQYEQLLELPVRKFILALDPDDAGYKGIEKLKRALRGRMLTRLVIPPGKDINDLSYQEFISLPEIFI